MIELRTSDPNSAIALRGIHVKARIAALAVHATIEQTFVNLEAEAIEAIYTFPLPDQAAVCGFEIRTGDRVIVGAAEESESALRRYDAAIEQGHAAYALEAERPDVFTLRVGNLKPRQAVTIAIKYIAPLSCVDRSLRVAFPITIGPRYATVTGRDPLDAAMDDEALNPPRLHQVPYGLTLEADFELAEAVRDITSPTDAIRCTNGGSNRYRVTLANELVAPDHEIVLEAQLAQEASPQIEVVQAPDGETYVALTFIPEFTLDQLLDPTSAETVFVMDCSGSMEGSSIDQARRALTLCLKSMNPGDRFNVCRFGSSHQMLADVPLTYSAETLQRALNFIAPDADLGGTELMAPLAAVLESPANRRRRNVVLLTDGQVTNEPAIVELAERHRATSRFFTFGIGPSCSTYLVNSLARVTGGAAEFISGSERIETKVLRVFSRIASPVLGDIRIDWGAAEVETIATLPAVFDADTFSVFARVSKGILPPQIRLVGLLDGEEMAWTLSVPAVRSDSSSPVPQLWARQMIQQYEDRLSYRGRGRRKDHDRWRRELVRLSEQSGVLCSLTTFVAVEHRSIEERESGQPALRRVPLQLPQVMPSRVDRVASPYSIPASSDSIRFSFVTAHLPGSTARREVALKHCPRSVDDVAAPLDVDEDKLLELLVLQNADGSFQHSSVIDELYAALGYDVPSTGTTESDTTLRVLAILRHHFWKHRDTWRRSEAKALIWLKQVTRLSVERLRAMAGASK